MNLNISNIKLYQYYQELILLHDPQCYSCAFSAILHGPDQLTCYLLWTHCCWFSKIFSSISAGVAISTSTRATKQETSCVHHLSGKAFLFTTKAQEQTKNATHIESLEDRGSREGNDWKQRLWWGKRVSYVRKRKAKKKVSPCSLG